MSGKNKTNSRQTGIEDLNIQFNLLPLLDRIESDLNPAVQNFYKTFILKEKENQHPLFGDSISSDYSKKYPELSSSLISFIFSYSEQQDSIGGIFPVHTMEPFYITAPFEKQFMNQDLFEVNHTEEVEKMVEKKFSFLSAMILNQFYKTGINFDSSITMKLIEKNTGFFRYFKTIFDSSYIRIESLTKLPELNREELQHLVQLIHNKEAFNRLLPLSSFKISGFIVVRKIEVTDDETTSEITRELINQYSLVDDNNYKKLEHLIRSKLRMNQIHMGILAVHQDQLLMLNKGAKSCKDQECIYRESKHYSIDMIPQLFLKDLFEKTTPLLIHDFKKLIAGMEKHEVHEMMIEEGVASIAAVPLIKNSRIIGIFLLSAHEKWTFGPDIFERLSPVIPLFSEILQKRLEEFNNEIDYLIKLHFTSIHPSIEWKFKQAARKLIDERQFNRNAEMEKIVFNEVYPLYSVSDIRGSSTFRNNAILSDLTDHLKIIREILNMAYGHKPLPIIDEYLYRIDKYLTELTDGLATGDEISILQFFRSEIEPALDDFAGFHPDVEKIVKDYYSQLDPEMGTFYKRRKDFDQSIDLINAGISSYLDQVQPQAQAMFPHYFDKNTTDGVDQNIYMGQSLTRDQRFDRLYLRNMRLWQILVLCNIARLTDRLMPQLRIPLETTHLIVVQDMPLNLIFKEDEKKLAVEGAYNIRYEIMKKRIDKAVIKATGERLTQVGKIAIVYTQNSEAQEYRQYLEFLAARGFVENTIEDVLLEDLQGIKGLHALRVPVRLEEDQSLDLDLMKIIQS